MYFICNSYFLCNNSTKWVNIFHVCFQGKFIRIHFGPMGKLAGADIETCKNFISCKQFASYTIQSVTEQTI